MYLKNIKVLKVSNVNHYKDIYCKLEPLKIHSTCKNKKRLNLLNIIEKMEDIKEIWEEQVEVISNKCISGRLCIMKKDDKAIKSAIKGTMNFYKS